MPLVAGLRRRARGAVAPLREKREARIEERDTRRLESTHPLLAPSLLRRWQDALADAHAEYVATMSVANMAASLETCAYIAYLCDTVQPRRVVDVGSGFSSYVLRRYAANDPAVSVVSVDHDQDWLAKTREFLASHDLPANDLLSWDEFVAAPDGYDLAFHDYAHGDLREATMPDVVTRVKPGGLIVFDDAQHSGHRRAMAEAVDKRDTYSLRRWTLDDIGRYSLVAIRR